MRIVRVLDVRVASQIDLARPELGSPRTADDLVFKADVDEPRPANHVVGCENTKPIVVAEALLSKDRARALKPVFVSDADDAI